MQIEQLLFFRQFGYQLFCFKLIGDKLSCQFMTKQAILVIQEIFWQYQQKHFHFLQQSRFQYFLISNSCFNSLDDHYTKIQYLLQFLCFKVIHFRFVSFFRLKTKVLNFPQLHKKILNQNKHHLNHLNFAQQRCDFLYIQNVYSFKLQKASFKIFQQIYGQELLHSELSQMGTIIFKQHELLDCKVIWLKVQQYKNQQVLLQLQRMKFFSFFDIIMFGQQLNVRGQNIIRQFIKQSKTILFSQVIFLMKKDTKIPVINQYQTISPATKLLQKRRKMYEIHQAFELQKQQFKNQQLNFKGEQDKIKSKDKQLQYQLTKFCQFLQQNQSKRKKAEERFKFQEKAYTQKQEQIKSLEKQIEELTRNQKKYLNRALHLRKYEDFLQKVRSSYSDQYPQMADILTRYQTLKKSNDQLIKNRQKMEGLHQKLKKDINQFEKQQNQSTLTLNNQIKQLSRKIQDKTHQKNQVQAQVQRSNEEYSNKNLNLGKIFMAIQNLHYRCNQNSYRLKYEFDQKGNIQKKQAKGKKMDNQFSMKNDEQTNYQQRSKHAATKLKSILSYMKDFKAIIDQYKTNYNKHGKQKNEKY